jgi:hypothetical protein
MMLCTYLHLPDDKCSAVLGMIVPESGGIGLTAVNCNRFRSAVAADRLGEDARGHLHELTTGLVGLQQRVDVAIRRMLGQAIGAEEQGIPHMEPGLVDLRPEVVESPTEGVPQHRAQPRRGPFVRREHARVHELLRQGVAGPAARF